MHRSRLGTVVIDCQTADLDRAAGFWAKALNRPARKPQDPADANYRELETPPGEVVMAVQQVDHPSRVHIDIETDDIEAEARRLEALGAKRVGTVHNWCVMEAPTGQRFCLVRPQRPDFKEHANVWK